MLLFYLTEDPFFYFSWVLTLVVSIVLHEMAHGYTAVWQGDRSPLESGRLSTPDPMLHMGPISLILCFTVGMAFGAMPVQSMNFKGRHSEAIVSAAGPAMNLLLALLAATAVGLWIAWGGLLFGGSLGDPREAGWAANLQHFLWIFAQVNLCLAVFNLLPIPPLDGSSILANLNADYRSFLQRLYADPTAAIVLVAACLLGLRLLGYPYFELAQRALIAYVNLCFNTGLTLGSG
jgi:Zn-dependent protease